MDELRVSVATLDRVVFQSPCDGTLMLALERKATLLEGADGNSVCVRAQPFGGAVHLHNSDALRDLIGDFQFDSERSRIQQDFRILIRPTDWAAVKQFCLHHLQNGDGTVLESDPSRELVEEFGECLQVDLRPSQYVYRPVGVVVENDPTPTDNVFSRGLPTVRVYRIFDVRITDDSLCRAVLNASESCSDAALQALAIKDAHIRRRGWANAVLTLPLKRVYDYYLGITPESRYTAGFIEGHQLDISVMALFEDVEVPQFQRL